MANIFVALPLPAFNGPGAPVDVSAMGGSKTIAVVGSFPGATITIEASVDGGTVYGTVVAFQNGEMEKTVAVAAQFMRVNVSGRRNPTAFSASIGVGANDAGSQIAALPMPVLNGPGAAVDVSALPDFYTFVCGGDMAGAAVLVELSEDGSDWAPVVQFSGQGGLRNTSVTAQFMRVNVSGRKSSVPFAATLAVGATTVNSGGGGGSGAVQFNVTGPFTADHTAAANDLVQVDPSGGPITITLPLASSAPGGVVVVKRIVGLVSLDVVTIAPTGADTIDAAATATLEYIMEYGATMFVSDGVSNWEAVAANRGVTSQFAATVYPDPAGTNIGGQSLGVFGGPYLHIDSLDLSALRMPSATSNTGGGDNIVLPNTATQLVQFLVSSGGPISVTGIDASAIVLPTGRLFMLRNDSLLVADTITLKHEDAGSTDVNRFRLPGAVDLVIPQFGAVWLYYSFGAAGGNRWYVVGGF